jgi:hypothetical protein
VIGMMAMKRMAGSPSKAREDLPFDIDALKNDAEQVCCMVLPKFSLPSDLLHSVQESIDEKRGLTYAHMDVDPPTSPRLNNGSPSTPPRFGN